MASWTRAAEAENAAYGILIHTFEELEPEYVKEYTRLKNKKIWCVGPVSLCNKDTQDIAERGNKAAINEHNCLQWLDEREPGSVLYVCLGSFAHVSTEQAIELGLGLESVNRPFIWCVRNETKELETWFSEHGFEDRVVTWPFFADQFLNETFIVEILKIGVEIAVLFGDEDKAGVVVKKEDVKKAVECLMEEDEDGKQRRNRARELAEMAKRAMAEGGSSYENVSSMIRDITETIGTNDNIKH
ncbi:hypothetical protein L1987_81552 [Smallanthus sonchifolius]|uniref:Uncharacterized protein n=1 Tax=Smallanthus sonchifolius TaxID=185202 RepID=A0ACB8YSD0_9ASTR|nr:hypothetical protein L1987_81552 [Smallanthus sonchifolius]